MHDQPLVSVLMTAYNRENYIAEAIESVLGSTHQNWELVIVDDCSKDKTVAIAKNYADKDKRIHVYINEKNLGDYPNRNKAISLSNGEYIMFCDSDDKLLPESISKILNLTESIDNFNFALSWPFCKQPINISSCEALTKHFFNQQFLYIGPGGSFMRRSFVNLIGQYPEKYGPANDMYFNLKVACNTSILLFPFDLIFYRQHENQEINNRYSYLYNNFLYMNDALTELPLPFSKKQIRFLRKKNYRRFIVNLFKYYRKTHDYKSAVHAWHKAGFKYKYLFMGIFH